MMRRVALVVSATLLPLVAMLATIGSAAGQSGNSSGTVGTGGTGGTGGTASQYELQIVDVDTSAAPQIAITYTVPPEVIAAGADPRAIDVRRGTEPLAAAVQPVTGAPEIGILIDRSASMFGEPLAAAIDASRACLAGLPLGSTAFLISYSNQPTLDHVATPDLASVSRTLDVLVASGDTATHDSLMAASQQFATDDPDSGTVSGDAGRFIILLSDGVDTASQSDLDRVLGVVDDVGIGVFSVAIDSGDTDVATLARIATGTGGVLIETNPDDLVGHCGAISNQIANRYVVSFDASGGSGGSAAPINLTVGGSGAMPTASASLSPGASGLGGRGTGSLDGLFGPGTGGLSLGSPDGAAPESLASASVEVPVGPGSAAGAEVALPAELPIPDTAAGVAGAATPATSARALWVGAGAVFAGFATMLSLVFVPSQSAITVRRLKPARPTPEVQDTLKGQGLGKLGNLGSAASNIVESIMHRGGVGASLNASLDAAGINLRPSEYVAAFVGASIGGFFVLALAGFSTIALVAFVIGPLAGRFYLKFRTKKRLKAFQAQLVETLMVMSGSVRAGHGLMQSISSVAEQADEPTAGEFGRVITEVRIGRDSIDSLRAMAERVGSTDLTWTVRAMALNRELGGNLAEILDNIADTIRERNKISDQVRALSAEGKFSAYVLFGLPFGVVGAVRVLNPEYIEPLFNTTKGYTVCGVALTLMTIGAIWIRKMIQIEY